MPPTAFGHDEHEVAPAAAETVPAAHDAHLVEPSELENLPASHLTHCEPFEVSL